MSLTNRLLTVASLIGFSTVSCHAIAQAVPPAVDPGLLQRELGSPPELQTPSPAPLMPQQRPPRPQALSDERFLLRDVRLVGNERIADDRLRDAFADLLDEQATLSDLYDIADAITARYRQAGFILSQAVVPAQMIDAGVVEIRIVEGFVDRVEFTDERSAGRGLLSRYADRLSSSRPLDVVDLERNMLLLNDLPGLVASSSVGRSADGGLGAARLRLSTVHDPVEGSVAVNNRGSERVGPGRLDASIRFNLQARPYPQFGIRALVATDSDELGLFSTFADIGVGSSGSRLRLSISTLRSEPDIGFEAFDDLETTGTTLEATWSRPLFRSRLTNRYLTLGFKAFDSQTEGQAVGDQLGTDDETKTRQVMLGLRFDHVDSGLGVNQLQLSLSQGIDGLGASDSRAQGEPKELDFTTLSLYAARLQSFGGRASVLLAATGQASLRGDNPPTSETFGVGGEGFVRGYDASEITGPSGAALKLEARYAIPPLARLRMTPYGFYDIGSVVDGFDARTSLSSAGAGLRFRGGALGGYAEYAVPLDGDVSAERSDDPRFFAGLSINF